MSANTMSYFDDSEDTYPLEQYRLQCFEALEGPPIIAKKTRLIAAVVENQVEVLRELLDSPKWYNTTDGWGYSLLQIAILCERVDVFDYMLSLPNFPLEFKNRGGSTALVVSLTETVSQQFWLAEYFTFELVKKGACINVVCGSNMTPLHSAVLRGYSRTVELLIERGIDLNVRYGDNCSALRMAISSANGPEIIPMLLSAGAEPSVFDFELSVLKSVQNVVDETFFLHIFDKFSVPTMHLDALVVLAHKNPDLFYDVIYLRVKATVENTNEKLIFSYLCILQMRELKVILERFADELKEAFLILDSQKPLCSPKTAVLENLDVILQSKLGINCINAIAQIAGSTYRYVKLPDICQRYCFFFSYDMKPTVRDLIAVHKTYGYCELFKIILQMDIQHYDVKKEIGVTMPIFIYNVEIDPVRYLSDPTNYPEDDVERLMDYFVHPQLIKLHLARVKSGTVKKRENIPKVPKLVELARNEVRKYCVKNLELRNSRQFYTYLKRFFIAETQKKIISFETKLY